MSRLTRSKFEAWLKTKQPDEIVGENRDCHCCPIANFYDQTNGGWEIVVFGRWGDYYIDRGGGARRAPAWAANFFSDIDREENGKITARRALQVLAECY